MKRLIRAGLMFGNLFEVSSTALVARYNRALQHLTGKTTDLEAFHVDISGFSPEIADALGDTFYLNPNGCNRQFILLSTDQKTAPLLNMQFSTSRRVLRQFIEENEAQLFALTTRDVVCGELVNSVYDVSTAARLLDIRQIRIEADTIGAHVADARTLDAKIERFRTSRDGWWDDVLIAEMIELAKRTGDITRNPLSLDQPVFETGNFWTAHFGGLYVFGASEHPAMIGADTAPEGVPLDHVFALKDTNKVARFLELNGLVEPIVQARGIDASRILRQKMTFVLVDMAAERGENVAKMTPRGLRRFAQANAADLPEAFRGLSELYNWAEAGGRWPRITSEHPAYFYTLRATPGPDRDLVNRLLAELCPLDIRQLFICHKDAFYAAYRGWSDTKRGFVARYLADSYMSDKAGVREALFGGKVAEDVEDVPDPEAIIEIVGPWGPVERMRK